MSQRPNVIYILADDMGFSDIGCFGAEIATPHLDRLAAGGVRQSQFYNCARCCPTRAALLTGMHPHRVGVGQMVSNLGYPAYQGYLKAEVPTLAERLRDAGYRTWMSGKWHVGGEYRPHLPEQWREAGGPGRPTPTQRGFERFYGTLAGAGSYFEPPTLTDQDRLVDRSSLPADYYLTTELGRRAIGFVDEALEEGRPFFGYLAFTAPHWPLHAPESAIAPYRGRYLGGWDELRERRLERLRSLGILPPGQVLSGRDPDSRPWAEAPHQAWEAERMAVYAAQVTTLDDAIGGLVEHLRRRGVLDDTLLLFCSDNGGCAEFLREDGAPGTWPEFYGGALPRGGVCTVGNRPGVAPGGNQTYMSYDLPWANASNTPFRKFKSWTHEGGISSPCVVHWPAGLPAGVIRHQPGHICDLAATACALAGADGAGLDGSDLSACWREGTSPSRAEPLCWEHQGHAAVRDGRWKIVRAGASAPWELYDIEVDRVEERDLAAQQPERVAALDRVWRAWAERCGVLPWPVKKR